jgi:hypothetical protein
MHPAYYFEFRLARACPEHPRLTSAFNGTPKTWVAGPSPATGIFSSRSTALVGRVRGASARRWSADGVFMIAETWYHLFRDGLMAAESLYYDLASLLKQIGALPKKGAQWR